MVNEIIRTYDLTKVYKLKGQEKSIVALNNVNISINEGEIFGLLGPNGAGKTTMASILTTILSPTSGYAIVDGFNILKNQKQIKRRVGLMLGSSMLYYRITGYDNLKFFSNIYDIPNYKEKINNLAKEFELDKWLNQYVEKYSSGMKMNLALIRTLLVNPKILFLDEPTLGLDVKNTLFMVKKLKELNKTIFLTSHDMNVIEKLCSRIAFLSKGNIIKIGTKEDIKQIEKKEIFVGITISKNKEELMKQLENQVYVKQVKLINNGLKVCINSRDNYQNFLKIIANFEIYKLEEIELGLEDLFLKLI